MNGVVISKMASTKYYNNHRAIPSSFIFDSFDCSLITNDDLFKELCSDVAKHVDSLSHVYISNWRQLQLFLYNKKIKESHVQVCELLSPTNGFFFVTRDLIIEFLTFLVKVKKINFGTFNNYLHSSNFILKKLQCSRITRKLVY